MSGDPCICGDTKTWHQKCYRQALAAQAPQAAEPVALAHRAMQWGSLYDAASRLIAAIGYHGDRSTRDSEVLWLQECLRVLDNSEHMPGLMPAAHAPAAPISAATEAMMALAIQFEKLLCAKLGDDWHSGVSVQSLLDRLVPVQAPAAQPLIDQNDPAVRECIEGWLLLDNVALVPGECVPLQTSAPVTYPILVSIFEAGYKSGGITEGESHDI